MIYKFLFNDIRRGIGKSYITISSDKDKYKETLLYSVLHNCTYDFICEGSKGDYLYYLISLYEDKEYFIVPVKELLYKAKTRDLISQCLDILMEYYYDGNKEIKDYINDYYNYFITTKYWNKNKILSYEYLCIIMSRLFGLDKILLILDDIKRLNIHFNDIGWFIANITLKYKDNEYIKSLQTEKDYIKKEYNHSFEEFIELVKTENFCYCFGSWASNDDHNKCLDYILSSTDTDLIIKILRNYQVSEKIKRFDSCKLLTLVSKFNDDVDYEVYSTLAYNKDKVVEELGLKLINDDKYIRIGIHMLITNYNKKYNDILINAYKKIKFSFNSHEGLVHYIYNFMYSKKKDLPDELLLITYHKNYCSFCREYVVRAMRKRNVLTHDILQQLPHDFDYGIRRFYSRMKK